MVRKGFLCFLFVFLLVCSVGSVFVVVPVGASTPAGTITYSAVTDTITVIGANSTHPCEFLDLYNADVAGGWGQVFRQNVTQYLFDCKIVIGNGTSAGTTYFVDYGKQVTFNNGVFASTSYDTNIYILVRSYAHLTLGTLVNFGRKTVRDGCFIISLEGTYGHCIISGGYGGSNHEINLYGCYIKSAIFGSNSAMLGRDFNTGKVYDCVFENVQFYRCANVVISGLRVSGQSLYLAFGNNTLNDIEVQEVSSGYAVSHAVANATYNNLEVVGVSGTAVSMSVGGTDVWAWLVNPVFENWTFSFIGLRNIVFRQYEFDLFVLNGEITDFVENANVTLTKDDVVYFTGLTNSTGQIATQTLTYGYYNQTGGNTMYGGTPWTLTINHPDWADYESRFYPTDKMELSVSLQDTVVADNNVLMVGFLGLVGCVLGGVVVLRLRRG